MAVATSTGHYTYCMELGKSAQVSPVIKEDVIEAVGKLLVNEGCSAQILTYNGNGNLYCTSDRPLDELLPILKQIGVNDITEL